MSDEQQTAKELWIEQAIRFIKQVGDEADEIEDLWAGMLAKARVAGMVSLVAELSVLDVDEIEALLKTSKPYREGER